MQIQRVTDLNALACISNEWNAFATGNPMLSWQWLSAWWSGYGEGLELCVLLVHEDSGELIGIAPWFMESSVARGRRIKFLGSGHACSDYLRLLCKPQHQDRVVSALAKWLMDVDQDIQGDKQLDNSWDFLSFEGVAAGESSLTQLRQEMELLGCRSGDDDAANCWRLSVPATWEGYLSELGSKQKRRKVKDTRRKFIENGRSEFEIASTNAELDAFYESFIDLHQRRRVSLGEKGCFAKSEFGIMLRTASERFFASGDLLLTRVLIDREIAGASIGFRSGDVHFMYLTGMNPDFQELGPGWVLNVHNILHAMENGITSIDYLRGDEPYKARLGASKVPLAKFRIVANTARAKLLNQAWLMRTALKARRLPFVSNVSIPTPSHANRPCLSLCFRTRDLNRLSSRFAIRLLSRPHRWWRSFCTPFGPLTRILAFAFPLLNVA